VETATGNSAGDSGLGSVCDLSPIVEFGKVRRREGHESGRRTIPRNRLNSDTTIMKTTAKIPAKLWAEFLMESLLTIAILILCHLLK
jgi:hypothetical protein